MSIATILRHAFTPALPQPTARELLRAGLGAMLGIAGCALLAPLLAEAFDIPVLLFAPLGASAVLVFAMPNAPLAQPWSAVIGNVTAALAAIAVLMLVAQPFAPALAVGAAILAMLAMRALHPPGGAVALLAALDPLPVLEVGFVFALVPVGLLTAVLVLCGILFHRLSGRIYPFRHMDDMNEADAVEPRLGLSEEELAALLSRFNQSQNIGVADLGRLLAAAEFEAACHRFDQVTCAQIMTAELITARPDTKLAELARLFRRHAIKSLPIVDDAGAIKGLVLQADLIEALLPGPRRPVWRKERLSAADVMRPPNAPVAHDLPVGQLLNRLAGRGVEVVPVTREGKLAGVITRSDIIALLLQGSDRRMAA
ncbi:HPP family protein [Sulfitobacter aestuarii]|uniref:HPP family protein n=1 Tax=Sulfitobacter aestuarii TaxID=2161676 RepID=A0ABW5U3F7_9RHOB